MEHEGSVFVVTGAASGIGRAVAQELSGQGARLVLTDLSSELSGVAEALGAEAIIGDLTDPAINRACVSTALNAFGRIDGAVMCAAVVSLTSVAEADPDDFRRVLDINLMAPFHLTQAIVPEMRRQGDGGALVYVGSKDAFDPVPNVAAYSVSKAALVQLAKTVALEEGRHGIRANLVHPDVVMDGSGLWDDNLKANRAAKHGVDPSNLAEHYRSRNALNIVLSSKHMADAVSFLLSSRAEAITGGVLNVDGGYGPAFPR